MTTLRLLAAILAVAASLYSLTPLWLLAWEALATGAPVSYSFSLVEGDPRGVRVRVSLTYLSSVPIRRYTLIVEPKCEGCSPGQAAGDLLAMGDTITVEVGIAGPPERVQVAFEGLVAGLYRFKASGSFPMGSGGG